VSLGRFFVTIAIPFYRDSYIIEIKA